MRAFIYSIVFLICSGCLFNSSPPKSDEHTGIIEVWGVVYHRFGSNNIPAADTWVRIQWLSRDNNGQLQPWGPPDALGVDRNGVYRIRHAFDSALQGVEVKTLGCHYNPADTNLQCCLRDEPTCQNCNQYWYGYGMGIVSPGESIRVDVILPCN